ncbi:MAG: hypothetical protein WHX60_06970 [Armatimonadota bacterium]
MANCIAVIVEKVRAVPLRVKLIARTAIHQQAVCPVHYACNHIAAGV